MRNLFPKRLIDKMFAKFSEKKEKLENVITPVENEKDVRYIKLPYIGEFSRQKYKSLLVDFVKIILKLT